MSDRERDERRARLEKHARSCRDVISDPYTTKSYAEVADLLEAELSAGQRDREALAEARELLVNTRSHVAGYGPKSWAEKRTAFLKRTEPADD